MATIIKRSDKTVALTHNELDNNFENLNNDKLEKGLYNYNNTILIKNNAGAITEIVIAASRIVGRKSTGEIVALTAAEVIAILFPASAGWTAATGTATKGAFATSTVTLPELAEQVKAIKDFLMAASLLTA